MLAALVRFQKYVWGSLFAVLILAGVLSGTAGAFNPQPDPPGFGMIGIAQGQTARLNLVHAVSGDVLSPPDPCRALLRFFDADGNLLARRRVDVAPGRSTFLDFTPSFAPPIGDVIAPARAQIRAAVAFGSDSLLAPDPCRVTLEIFDNATGRTEIVLAGRRRAGE